MKQILVLRNLLGSNQMFDQASEPSIFLCAFLDVFFLVHLHAFACICHMMTMMAYQKEGYWDGFQVIPSKPIDTIYSFGG